MIYLILSVFFGYSQAECDICGWPWTTGVNSSGQCYLSYQGMQGGLESGCYTYCDAWARSIPVQQPASPMLSFSGGASGVSCQCQRLNQWGDVEYKTRPTGACDWGYSDDVQRHYDSIAINWRSQKNDSAISSLPVSQTDVAAMRADAVAVKNDYYYASCSVTGAYPPLNSDGTCIQGAEQLQYYATRDGIPYYHCYTIPSTMNCIDFMTGAVSPNATALKTVLENQGSLDTSIIGLKKGIDQVQKSVSSGQSAVLDALAKLQEKPTGGGGSVVDLSPVLSAIEAAKNLQIEATGRVGDSVSSSGNRLAGRMMSLESKQDSMISALDGLADSISELGSGIGSVRTAVKDLEPFLTRISDSVSSLKEPINRVTDSISSTSRSVRDSIGRLNASLMSSDSFQRRTRYADSASANKLYEDILDSLGREPRGKSEAESKLSELGSVASQGEANASGFIEGLSGFKSLPGTCSDAPSFEIDLTSAHLGVMTVDMSKYPWVISLSRGIFRFLGAFAGIMVIVSALSMLGLSNAKRSN